MDHQFANIHTFRRFAIAGHAIFTIVNSNSGNHLTFKLVKPPKDDKDTKPTPIFASVLTGPDNTSSYSFIGSIWLNNDGLVYRHSRKSNIMADAPSVKTIEWILNHFNWVRELPEGVYAMHNGHCGHCGRVLTTPDSIRTGIGPICSGR